MKTTLIAIPTSGKRKDIFYVIESIRKSFDGTDMKPLFSVCADDETLFNVRQLDNTLVFSLNPEKFDYTHHIIEAIKRGTEKFNPDFVSTIADDFTVPAKQFSKVIEPLLNGCDATFGCWGSNETASTYPKFQYVSELFVNRITNAASKTSIPDYENMLSYSFDYESDFSDMTQIFCGIFAFRKDCWTRTLDRMMKIFGTTKLGWSLEVAVLLALKDLGLKATNVACNKVKETNLPVLGEKSTRLVQIKDAFECVNIFLKYTKQHEKIQNLSKIQSEMTKVIEDILTRSGT